MEPDAPTPPSDESRGAAAAAIAAAEVALAHQNSAVSQLDLQVISAILNAHETATGGSETLRRLQEEIEVAVRARSDLDTPAGARDFQRYLIGKLRDIRAVVAGASLDDTSKSALMAAWTALYSASKDPPTDGGGPPAAAAAGGARQTAQLTPPVQSVPGDPELDSLLLDDPGSIGAGAPVGESAGESAVAPTTPSVSNVPPLGAGSMPALGSLPSLGGLGAPSGLPLSGRLGDGRDEGDPDGLAPVRPDLDDHDKPDPEGEPHDRDEDERRDKPEAPAEGPTSVTLPDGETVTAASPQLAAAIQAAAGGMPIAEAFRQQGISIPEPGTAVPHPLDPSMLTPGDIGILTDRHALALGTGKAILDGRIQHISNVSGPAFLGWQHPPAPIGVTAPASTDAPTPTRPAVSAGLYSPG